MLMANDVVADQPRLGHGCVNLAQGGEAMLRVSLPRGLHVESTRLTRLTSTFTLSLPHVERSKIIHLKRRVGCIALKYQPRHVSRKEQWRYTVSLQIHLQRHSSADDRPSISRFFKRKTPPQSSQPKVVNTQHVIEVVDDGDDTIEISDSPPAKKPKSSSYFGSTAKSATSQVEPNAEAGPSRKPSRHVATPPAHLQSYRLPPISSASTRETGAFGAFSNPSIEASLRPTQQRTAAQQEQHEKWHRKVVGGSLIRRRRSLALDEAEALEARKLITGDDVDEGDGSATPPIVTVDSDEERQTRAEQVGNGLAAKYGAKTDGKGKVKAVNRKKKEEEVGPSGQTYTPLEKQYMEIKAKNPDVLLLMEGESLSCGVSRIVARADYRSWIQVQVGRVWNRRD